MARRTKAETAPEVEEAASETGHSGAGRLRQV
jgi:hypothetical protein